MDDNNASSYQINQEDKEYIVTTQLINDLLRIECEDKNIISNPIYSRAFSLTNLKEMNNYFQPYDSIQQIQEELNSAIENQSAAIFNSANNTINITFYLKNKISQANISLKLLKEKNEPQKQRNKEDFNNFEFQGRCSCPLDNERIDKLEVDSGKLQNDHEYLRNELNQLRKKKKLIKVRINKLKEDNAK